MKAYYDLHIHTCLSPCGDSDMTPNNIANMAYIKGLDVIAVTDHNTGKNVPAVMACAASLGVLCIPGIEVQTKEEVHVLCYFHEVEQLNQFELVLDAHRLMIPNRPEKFGEQVVVNEKDEIVGNYPFALIVSVDIRLDQLKVEVEQLEGVIVPAHINKQSNSILSHLGFIPEEMAIKTVEVFKNSPVSQALLGHRRVVYNSDAHVLEQINEPVHFMNIDALTVGCVLNYLKGMDRV